MSTDRTKAIAIRVGPERYFAGFSDPRKLQQGEPNVKARPIFEAHLMPFTYALPEFPNTRPHAKARDYIKRLRDKGVDAQMVVVHVGEVIE